MVFLVQIYKKYDTKEMKKDEKHTLPHGASILFTLYID